MEFQNFYMTEAENLSTIELNLKDDLYNMKEIQFEMYKASKNYFNALTKTKENPIKQIYKGNPKTSKILETRFILHKWDTLYELVVVEYANGGEIYLFDVGGKDKNGAHFYYIGNNKKFFNKSKMNAIDVLISIRKKMEAKKEKDLKAIEKKQEAPKPVQPLVKQAEMDHGHPIWGYFGIDGTDMDMIHGAIVKNKNRKYIRDFNFQNKVGEGHKYKLEGSDEDVGIVYMIAFNDKALGGVLVFYKEVSFKIAYELGMFKGLEIGNDYPHDDGRKRQLRNIDQLHWEEIAPESMTIDKDPVKEIEDVHTESKDYCGNILNEMHNISVNQICDYLEDFEFNK